MSLVHGRRLLDGEALRRGTRTRGKESIDVDDILEEAPLRLTLLLVRGPHLGIDLNLLFRLN